MKTSIIGALLFTVAAVPAVYADTTLYSNTNQVPSGYLSGAANEIGDEIVLADNGTGSTINSFSFSFYNDAPDNTATLSVFLYANTGVASSTGPLTPSATPIWTESFLIPNAPTGYSVDLTGDAGLAGTAVPSDFTWAVEFSGLGGNDAGLIVSTAAPDIGGNYSPYWLNLGTSGTPNWVLATNNAFSSVNFLATIGGTANPPAPTPEPSSMALMGLGIAGLAGFLKRKANRS
jgi:hypothetical protein